MCGIDASGSGVKKLQRAADKVLAACDQDIESRPSLANPSHSFDRLLDSGMKLDAGRRTSRFCYSLISLYQITVGRWNLDG